MASKIEWLKDSEGRPGYTINPVKGLCPVGCTYCYAWRLYKRFHWDETIRFDVHGYQDAPDWNMENIKNPSKIFVGSTMELFGEWIEPRWMEVLFQVVRRYPQHTFIFLTKKPGNLIKWSPFPDNCWVGVSATDAHTFRVGRQYLRWIDAKVKFVSIEPLLDWDDMNTFDYIKGTIDWLIIGQQTPARPSTQPQVGWIKEIVEAADLAKIPVFLKDNLNSIFAANDCELYNKYRDQLFKFKDWNEKGEAVYHLRQEFPKVEVKA